MIIRDFYKDALIGLAVGDALGVPAEFKPRTWFDKDPIEDFTGFGTHHMPPGTWSDDSSLTFCLAEALTIEFDLAKIAKNFIAWREEAYWTATGEVFDIGNATNEAISRLAAGCVPEYAGGFDEESNGNGSLMRILPLLFYIKNLPIEQRFDVTKKVSSITHQHIRSVIACFYYIEFARLLISGFDKVEAYKSLQKTLPGFFKSRNINPDELFLFESLLKFDISVLQRSDIKSSGYVLHTLEASIWCLLTTSDYASAVLKAVNLGSDTDTTGAVTGGLAGLVYGYQTIPQNWLAQLARLEDILDLSKRLSEKFT